MPPSDELVHKSDEQCMKELHNSSDYADLTLTCQDRSWKVHRAILCVRSDWFRAACSEAFKEGKTGAIHFEEEDPTTIDNILSFLYLGYYEAPYEPPKWFGATQVHVRMHTAAQKYLIPGLKTEANLRLECLFSLIWEKEELFKVADYLYTYGPEGDHIRALFARGINEHLEGHGGYMKDQTFRTNLKDRPDFATDILMAMETADEEMVYELYCDACGVQRAICSECKGDEVSRVVKT